MDKCTICKNEIGTGGNRGLCLGCYEDNYYRIRGGV